MNQNVQYIVVSGSRRLRRRRWHLLIVSFVYIPVHSVAKSRYELWIKLMWIVVRKCKLIDIYPEYGPNENLIVASYAISHPKMVCRHFNRP